ncbi:unnamed protein product [Camellia sinensis]
MGGLGKKVLYQVLLYQRKANHPLSYEGNTNWGGHHCLCLPLQGKTMDIQDLLEEHQLVSMCIEGMLTTYKLHLVNHHFPDFSTLCVAARNTSEIVRSGVRREAPQPPSWRATAPPPSSWRPNRCNHAVYATEGSSGGRTNLQAKKRKFDQVPPPLLVPVDEAHALFNAWVENGKDHLHEPRTPVTKKDQARADH